MAKSKKPPRLRRIIISSLFALIALFAAGIVTAGFIISRVTVVERTTLMLRDLPSSLEGKTVLYVSDIDILGLSTSGGAAALFRKLDRLQPDLLILGGDYNGRSLLRKAAAEDPDPGGREARRQFFASLRDFRSPMGKFAVAAEDDPPGLAEDLQLGDITLLNNTAARIQFGGDQLILAGIASSGGLTDCSAVSGACSAGDCVITAVHSPAAIAGILTAEAADGGAWCDVILSGHNHDGQAVIGGRTMLKLTEQELRHGSGWSRESGAFVLVSPGLGCEGFNFRIGTRSKVHLITLRRAVPFEFSGGQG